MARQTWKHTAAVLAPLIVSIPGVLTAGAGVPTARNPGMDRLPADAARMYRFVTTPQPGELKWQQIPWLTDLPEGIRQAKAEKRPLVLFVSGDDPLEKC
jgi:hypothetical protein